jgi:hypothetical protein
MPLFGERQEECHKLIHYDGRSISFKSLGAQYGPVTFSLGEFETEVKQIQAASDLAMALDDYQYGMCTQLRSLRKDDPNWKRKDSYRTRAMTLLTDVRVAVAAFKADPSGQRENLYEVVKDVHNRFQKIEKEAKEAVRPEAEKLPKARKAVAGKTRKQTIYGLRSGAKIIAGGPKGVRFLVPDKRLQYRDNDGMRPVSKKEFKKRYPHDYRKFTAGLLNEIVVETLRYEVS